MGTSSDRRNFLKRVAVLGGAVASAAETPAAEAAQAPPAQPQRGAPATAAAPVSQGYTFLTPPEAAFVEAAVDVLVPADELTPSGTDLGLAVFIDRQLAGAWGKGDRLYRQGPWRQGPPGLGYQLPLAPAEFFRMGLAAANAHCRKTYAKEFDRLTGAQKQTVLEGLDRATLTLEGVSGKEFFDMFYQAAMEALFADPIYGGNRNKAAWKMIGYPGVIAVHATNITTYKNKKYLVEPVSIADLE
jgi:gluconate 2-dehydrogenase gamma chain